MVRHRSVARLGLAAWLAAASLAAACGGGGREADPVTRATEQVRAALSSDREWTRAETIRLLGVIGTPEFRAPLEAALDDPSPIVQTAAVQALLQLGARAVEEPTLSRMVSGTETQRLQLLDLVASAGRGDFRAEMITRASRDVSPRVQVSALRHAMATGTRLGAAELNRLVAAEDEEVAEIAFVALAEFDRNAALDLALRWVRSGDPRERQRGMRLARHLSSPSLWPMMRSYALQEQDTNERRFALLVLGHLGDPSAEEPLRDILLSAQPDQAAQALSALSHIPTPRARDQALVHRRDARAPVRRAALNELIRQRRPADDFVLFLEDSDPTIAEAALLHMQRSNPGRAAAIFSQALADSDDPVPTLLALYRVSLNHDIRRFLDATSNRLRHLISASDPRVAGLAARLLTRATAPAELLPLIGPETSADALYAVLEATLGSEANFSDLYTSALDHDVEAIRIVASLGIVALGEAYTPPVVEE